MAEDVAEDVDAVLVAVGTGELENGEVHWETLAKVVQEAKSNYESNQ